jgi:micrococcal nuclease
VPTGPSPGHVVITDVADGDTVTGQGNVKIRVRGIDTPETRAPGQPVECWGPQATAFARATLLGQQVRLVTDPGDLYDRYQRLVAELQLPDGSSYAQLAAAAGAGRAYTFDPAHPATDRTQIEAAERAARAAGRGLWGPPCNGS